MNKHFKVNPASYELYYDFEQKKGIQSSLTLSPFLELAKIA